MIKLRLKELREEPINFIRQKEIANLIGVHVSVYSQYEGVLSIPLRHLNTICNYYNVSFDYMMYLSNKRYYNNFEPRINYQIFSKRLKELRSDLGLSQNDFGESVGANQSLISKYECNKRVISIIILYNICQKYKISADYLLGKIDEPKYLD